MCTGVGGHFPVGCATQVEEGRHTVLGWHQMQDAWWMYATDSVLHIRLAALEMHWLGVGPVMLSAALWMQWPRAR